MTPSVIVQSPPTTSGSCPGCAGSAMAAATASATSRATRVTAARLRAFGWSRSTANGAPGRFPASRTDSPAARSRSGSPAARNAPGALSWPP